MAMLNIKSIRKPRGEDASCSADVAAEIQELQAGVAGARRELKKLDAGETALLLEYDAKGLEALQRDRDTQQRVLQRAAIALPMLQERLDAALAKERQAKWSECRAAILDAADNFAAAARQAHEACARLIAAREQAWAAGFSPDVNSIPIAPGLVNLAEPGQPQLAAFEQALAYFRKTAPSAPTPLRRPQRDPAPLSKAEAKALLAASTAIIPHGDLSHRVVLRQTPTPPASAKPAAAKTPAVSRPAAPPRPPPAPLPEVVPAGHRRCIILHSGYPDKDGRALRKGDRIDIPADTAQIAAMNGRVEFVAVVADAKGNTT